MCELADFQQVEAEGFHFGQYAEQCRPVQAAGEHGVGAFPLRHHGRERGEHSGTQLTLDPDRVPRGSWVHVAIVEVWLVIAPHQDRVTVCYRVGPADSNRRSRARCTAEDRSRAWSLA